MNVFPGRTHRKPRSSASYRGWRRNNAVKWFGVEPDHKANGEDIGRILEQIEETNYTKSIRAKHLSTTKEG